MLLICGGLVTVTDFLTWQDLRYGWCQFCHPADSDIIKKGNKLYCRGCDTYYEYKPE